MANLFNFGSGMLLSLDDFMNQASNRARSQYDAGLDATKRQAARLGVNPNSGSYLGMLNDAQYDRTAGINAATGDASLKWLGLAQDQFNRDRAYELQKQQSDALNNRWWTSRNDQQNNLGWERNREEERLETAVDSMGNRRGGLANFYAGGGNGGIPTATGTGSAGTGRGVSLMDAYRNNFQPSILKQYGLGYQNYFVPGTGKW